MEGYWTFLAVNDTLAKLKEKVKGHPDRVVLNLKGTVTWHFVCLLYSAAE